MSCGPISSSSPTHLPTSRLVTRPSPLPSQALPQAPRPPPPQSLCRPHRLCPLPSQLLASVSVSILPLQTACPSSLPSLSASHFSSARPIRHLHLPTYRPSRLSVRARGRAVMVPIATFTMARTNAAPFSPPPPARPTPRSPQLYPPPKLAASAAPPSLILGTNLLSLPFPAAAARIWLLLLLASLVLVPTLLAVTNQGDLTFSRRTVCMRTAMRA